MFIHLPRFSIPLLLVFSLTSSASNAQTTKQVSRDGAGVEGNGLSTYAAISGNGRFVAFESAASNLVVGDTNSTIDVFVYDRLLDTIERASVDSQFTQASGNSLHPSISADGRFVAFQSDASDLVAGDTNSTTDVFLRDRANGETFRVSINLIGGDANDWSISPSVSADGNCVAFASNASNLVLGDQNSVRDVFVYDHSTMQIERINLDSNENESIFQSYTPSISGDGSYVAFQSYAKDLVPGDFGSLGDIFVRNRNLGITSRVSVDSNGIQGNGHSYAPRISEDGTVVSFESYADNLVANDMNGVRDIFVHTIPPSLPGETHRVSIGLNDLEGNGGSLGHAISADGRFVAYVSAANNLVPNDTNGAEDVFVYDRLNCASSRISTDSFGLEANSSCFHPDISEDGRHVAFSSIANNLVSSDDNSVEDVFVHDRWDGLGCNSIHLTGPAISQVPDPLNLSWFNAPANSNYWLAYSLNLNGSIVGSHHLDIGNPRTLLDTGIHSCGGDGQYSSPPVSVNAVGHTVYFEVLAQDANEVFYDSNAIGVLFY